MDNKINISIITSLYRPSVYLYNFLRYVAEIDNLDECELILIHNDPLLEDVLLIDNFKKTNLLSVKHISVPREGLYSSWNRAIKIAKGNLIAVWNVDDIRNPSSLSSQKKALANTDAVMSYGDYYATNNYGKIKKELYYYDTDYNKLKQRAFQAHVIGCFPMWKKDIHDTVGYFDEQFKLVGDWEFQMRVVRNFGLIKADNNLGYCLVDKPHRLSSNRHLQYKEQTVVLLRFRIYTHLLLHYLPQIKEFKINYFLSFDNWENMSTKIPTKKLDFLSELKSLIKMPFVFMFWGFKHLATRIYKFFMIEKYELS